MIGKNSFTFFETENNINQWCFIDPDCGFQKFFDTEKQALSYSEAYCRGIFIDTSKEQERYDRAEENYYRSIDNEEYYEDWGWGFN